METAVFPTLGFIVLVVIAHKLSRGLLSLPSICMLYLTCLYIGGLRLWFGYHSNTYLYVLAGTGAYILGIAIARKPRLSRSRRALPTQQEPEMGRRGSRPVIAKRQEFYIGLHPQVLKYTLATLTLSSLAIWAYWLWIVGVPLLVSGNPSVGWIETSSGAVNRLLGSFGGENLVFEGLGWYVLYKVRKNRLYLLFAVGCVVGGALFLAFEGSKGSAVVTVLWFSIALFYFNRHTPKLKTLIVMGLFALPVTWWVSSYYVNGPGETPPSIIYNRMTTGAVEGLDFLVQSWVPYYGLAHGHTFSMDIARIKAQFLGGPRPVVFHEYIWNLLNDTPPYVSTGMSEALSVFGVGYANFGLPGGLLFMMVFGGVCEVLDATLMTARKMHFLFFASAIYLINCLISIFVSGDILIVGVESLMVTLLPKLLAFTAIYCFLALPFRIPLRLPKASGDRRAAPGPKEVPAAAGAPPVQPDAHQKRSRQGAW